MLEMLCPFFTIDEDIIKEDNNEIPQLGSKYFIRQCLECGSSIHEAKGNDQKFIVDIMCAKILFRDIIHMNPNLVIGQDKDPTWRNN